MPGVDLNLDLPTLADTFSDVVSKIVTAIEAIETDLAARVTAGELEIDTELGLGGAPLTNVGGVRLVGGLTSVPGSIYMDGDEFYLVTEVDTIQLTDNGAINIASVGTIGGDYGGSNPASVTFDNTSGEYRFLEDTGIYADLVADDLILHGAAGAVRIAVGSGVSNYTLTLPAAPASTVALQMASTGIITASNTFGSAVTATDYKLSSSRTRVVSASGDAGGLAEDSHFTAFTMALDVGDQINSWSLYFNKNSSAATTIAATLYSVGYDGVARTVESTATPNSSAAPGNITLEVTGLGTTAGNKVYYVEILVTGDATPDTYRGGKYTYRRV